MFLRRIQHQHYIILLFDFSLEGGVGGGYVCGGLCVGGWVGEEGACGEGSLCVCVCVGGGGGVGYLGGWGVGWRG